MIKTRTIHVTLPSCPHTVLKNPGLSEIFMDLSKNQQESAFFPKVSDLYPRIWDFSIFFQDNPYKSHNTGLLMTYILLYRIKKGIQFKNQKHHNQYLLTDNHHIDHQLKHPKFLYHNQSLKKDNNLLQYIYSD